MTDNGIHLNLSLGLSNQPGPPQRIEGKNDRSKVANLLAALDELKEKVGIPWSIKDSGLEEQRWLDQIDLVAARDAEGRDWISFDEIKDIYLHAWNGTRAALKTPQQKHTG